VLEAREEGLTQTFDKNTAKIWQGLFGGAIVETFLFEGDIL
jgi:hypothetical protein